MVNLVGKAKHDEIQNKRTGFGTKYPENDKYTLDFCFPDLPSSNTQHVTRNTLKKISVLLC